MNNQRITRNSHTVCEFSVFIGIARVNRFKQAITDADFLTEVAEVFIQPNWLETEQACQRIECNPDYLIDSDDVRERRICTYSITRTQRPTTDIGPTRFFESDWVN